METLEHVLLYLARHTPASPADLAAMETIITETFAPKPEPATAEEPAEQPAA